MTSAIEDSSPNHEDKESHQPRPDINFEDVSPPLRAGAGKAHSAGRKVTRLLRALRDPLLSDLRREALREILHKVIEGVEDLGDGDFF